MKFGLPESTVALLHEYFTGIIEIEKVVVYGSRAKGNYEKGSDIDLAVFSRSNVDLTGRLLTELDELQTPYFFNVTDYKSLKHKGLIEHIDRVGIVLYQNSNPNK